MLDLSHYETTLDPDRHTHVGIWRDELDYVSREFFDWHVPELPADVQQAIDTGMQAELSGINLDNVTDLLQPGYLPLETGIGQCENGEGSVAIYTRWPGTTPEMIDWWFGWHIEQTERYKLWHPQAHVFAQPKYDLSDVVELSDRDRYIGNTSWVDEYVGPTPLRLAITFHDPATIGLDQATLDAADYGTVIYAQVANSDDGTPGAQLIHAVRRTSWGSEMRSRFIFPPGVAEFAGAGLVDHCYTEMTHLASFLPRLYTHLNAIGPTAQ